MGRDKVDSKQTELSPETLSAQALGRVDPISRAIIPSLHPSTTFERDADGGYSSGRGYSRPHNPTYDIAEDLLSTLENGDDCLLFASGMAAANAVFQALLPGDHVVAPKVMYWALRKWLVDFAVSWGLEVEFQDTRDLNALEAAMRPGKTRLVWIETPANPTWEITDIKAVADISHAVGARLAVDNTVSSPALTQPIKLGADFVVHSASKYLNGHSDVLAGAVVCAKDDGFWQRIRTWRRDGGAMLGTLEAWLLQRGMRTLFVRMEKSSQSAMAIARFFSDHPGIHCIMYPGLPEHPGHAIAARQMHGGFSGMLSIRVKGGETAAMAVAASVKLFKRATSLGGVESLLEHRASIEGPASPVPVDLLRLSIGLENVNDLILDLKQALSNLPTGPSDILPISTLSLDNKSPIQQVLRKHVATMVQERGGDLQFGSFSNGVLELRMIGSPGASVPLERMISNTMRHYLSEVKEVRIIHGSKKSTSKKDTIWDRVAVLLDEVINPSVSDHDGKVTLQNVEGSTVFLRLEGGCQGCAMAELTLRQGIEPIIKKYIPEVLLIVDKTDHAAGVTPYFKTKKT